MTNALARLAFLEDENNKLRERAEAAKKRVAELEREVHIHSTLREEANRLNNEIAEELYRRRERIAELEAQLSEANRGIEPWAYRMEIEELNKSLSNLIAERDQLRAQLAERCPLCAKSAALLDSVNRYPCGHVRTLDTTDAKEPK